jgi:enamine deaminase RidA (YjgF/YER057c/UK114 family)
MAGLLHQHHARVFQERVFAREGAWDGLRRARREAYGDLDDGVTPAWLEVLPGPDGPVAGVQAHAIAAGIAPEPVEFDGKLCGRLYRGNGSSLLGVSGLSAPRAGGAAEQAHTMLEQAAGVIGRAGGDMFSVVRTWMWLRDILGWYGEFNRVRNRFFRHHGLLGKGSRHPLPASTGVGAGPACGGMCGMDALAVIGGSSPRQVLLAGGNQGPAYAYGSAFSRAAAARTPAGKTVYVSGTAAIDAAGRTEHVGDAAKQIAATISNVRAVLAQMGGTEGDLVQAIFYCKTPDVQRILEERWSGLDWPRVVVQCDICRADLLFEIEAAACLGARRLG